MAHTFAGHVFSLRFNGVEVGEIRTDAAIAGHFGIPVVMVSGDRAACDGAKSLLGNVETVAVKDGVGRYTGRCVPVEEARRMIRDGMKRGLTRLGQFHPFVFRPPIRAEVTFIDPSYADAVESMPLVKRVDGCTIAFEAEDFVKAFEMFNGLHFLARAFQYE